MPYDEALAERTRKALAARDRPAEKRMFGGICFMVDGHMCCGVAKDDLVVRVGPERYSRALERPHARPMDFTGKPLNGMVYVSKAGVRTKRDLERWLSLALKFVHELPPKDETKKKKRKKKTLPGHAKKTAAALTRKLPAESSSESAGFSGFGKQTLSFLGGLARNNTKTWFEAHRAEYQSHYVATGQSFVCALGPRLHKLSKTISFEPRVNGSIFRINRDVRFSKDKTPYKAHLDLWFWEGERKGWDAPGFFFRLEPLGLVLGAGLHRFGKETLARYRDAVVDGRRGKALADAIARVRSAGPYEIGGRSRKTVPRGFDAAHPRAELLLHDGLTAILRATHPRELGSAAFVDFCEAHYRNLAPLHRWLLRNLRA